MDAGLNIVSGVRVRLGDSLDLIKASLDEHNIAYSIPYQNEEGKDGLVRVNVVMFIEKFGVELNIANNRVTYIKSNNSELNYIMQLNQGMTAVSALSEIKRNIADKFNTDESSIRIDEFNGRTLDSSLSIPLGDGRKVKIMLIMGAHKKVYMSMIKLVTR